MDTNPGTRQGGAERGIGGEAETALHGFDSVGRSDLGEEAAELALDAVEVGQGQRDHGVQRFLDRRIAVYASVLEG